MHRGDRASRMSFVCKRWSSSTRHDSLAERSKAVAQGAIPKGRGFEPHSCHFLSQSPLQEPSPSFEIDRFSVEPSVRIKPKRLGGRGK